MCDHELRLDRMDRELSNLGGQLKVLIGLNTFAIVLGMVAMYVR